MKKRAFVILGVLLLVLAACVPIPPVSPPTPTVDPDIYNQAPDTTVYAPGECTVTLQAPAPAYTSNTLGGEPSAEIPAGQYGVGVAADYGSSVWFMLDYPGAANWINSADASSLDGICAEGVTAP